MTRARLDLRSWAALLLTLLAAWGLWAAWRSGLFAFLTEQPGEVWRLFNQHVILVFTSGISATAAGLALGIGISRPALRKLAHPAITLVGLGQTIPSLALLVLIFALVQQIGFLPAYLALTMATLLPIVRNTYLGLSGVEPSMLEAARGMGLSPGQVLWRIELPNALTVIFAGIRTAVVINVGSAALAFLIGGGGLGDLIFTGIDTRETDILVAGTLPTVLLALALDWLLGRLERAIMPRGLREG
ncbi:MAG: ABC transporter permease [SAR324 cluster bacterium]|nr:ABC transporter permease [SAR324 cluster bacterium]